jgi:Tfp pilus assembly protein PilV
LVPLAFYTVVLLVVVVVVVSVLAVADMLVAAVQVVLVATLRRSMITADNILSINIKNNKPHRFNPRQ